MSSSLDDAQMSVGKQLLAARNLTKNKQSDNLEKIQLLFLMGFDEEGVVFYEDDDE
jgi:hypothetical protein